MIDCNKEDWLEIESRWWVVLSFTSEQGKIPNEDRKKENNQIRMDNNGKILNVRSKENKNG